MANHLHKMDKDLTTEWKLRNENFDVNILFATILQKYSDFPVLQENPIMFKYQSDMWWHKHYRTFEKWFNAFDIPYSPLINNWKSEERTVKENEQGNQYNRFKNKDSNTDHHIGDAFENRDYINEYEDHDISNEKVDNDSTSQNGKVEITDNDTSSIKSNAQTDDKTITSIKDGTNNEVGSDESHTKTKSDVSVDVIGAQYTNEHSGGVSGTVGDPGEMTFVPATDTRKTENTLSAYNSSSYEPSSQDEIKGDMGNSGKNTSSTRTHGLADDNDVHLKDDNTKDTKYNELNSSDEQNKMNSEEHNQGSLDQTVTTTDIGKATDDTITEYKDDKNGQNTNNTKTTSNDKYINNSEGLHTGDSQQKNTVDKDLVEKTYHEGNIGVMTAQQMLTAEIKVQLYSIYDQIAELYVDENCVCIYYSPRQRGGCCIW